MPETNTDLHGFVPDQCEVALLLIDVINDLEWESGEKILPFALPMAQAIAALKEKARENGIPTVYVNDNFGQWRSDAGSLIDHCLNDDVRGRPVVELLQPDDDDYFVLKPKHSGFFSTTLDTLLDYLGAKTLILTGIAGNICVLFTANDAYMRDFKIVAPRDCMASNSEAENDAALLLMKNVLKAEIRPFAELNFDELLTTGSNRQKPDVPEAQPAKAAS